MSPGREADLLSTAQADQSADTLGYRRIYEKSAIGIFRSGLDGRYISANPAGVRLHGYDTEEELLSAVGDLPQEVYVDPRDRHRLTALLESRDSVLGFECRIFRHKSRLPCWVRQNVWKVFDAEGRLLYFEGHVEDIDDRKAFEQTLNDRIAARTAALEEANARLRAEIEERKQAEAALKENEKRFRDIFQAASDWHWEMDSALRFTFVSERFAEVTGLDPKAYIGKTRAEIHDGDLQDSLWLDHKRQLESRSPFRNFRVDTERPNGDWVHFAISGVPIFDEAGNFQGYRGTGSDITARVKAERLLAERETLLRSIVDNTPSIIVVKDFEGRFAFVNQSFVNYRGGTVESWIAKNAYAASTTEHAQAMREQDREAIETRKAVTREHKTELLDGKPYHRIVTKFPVSDGTGTMTGVATISTDVAELHEMRRALKKSEAQLQQAQKMEAVGQLTGGVAHDFNNLLGVIVGNLDILNEALTKDSDKGLVGAALRAALRGAELTNRLLAFSRKQSLRPETTDLNALVLGMTDLLRRTLGETIAIRTISAADLKYTKIDPAQLETALLNLAVNARHAMPEGGELTIETGNVQLDRNEFGGLDDFVPGSYVMLAVSDTGGGIPPDTMEHVFEPFFTTKEVGEGSGLGLSMVQGFVKQSGGQIAIQSEVGVGTTVKLFLPLAAAPKAETEGKPARKEGPRGRGELVLVVEDDPEMRKLAVRIISGLGYRTLEAADGVAALDVLSDTPEIELLFTDVVLPAGMGGVALAAEATKRRPGLKVLFTSGYTGNVAINNGMLRKEEDLLTKPYRRDVLAKRLRNAFDANAAE